METVKVLLAGEKRKILWDGIVSPPDSPSRVREGGTRKNENLKKKTSMRRSSEFSKVGEKASLNKKLD